MIIRWSRGDYYVMHEDISFLSYIYPLKNPSTAYLSNGTIHQIRM